MCFPFSGVWLLCNSNQALRRFISLGPHPLEDLEKRRNESRRGRRA